MAESVLVAGAISGTSVDGIDAAVVRLTGSGNRQRIKTVAFASHPYPAEVRREVLAISNAEAHTSRISQMNFLLGELFAEAIGRTCSDADIEVKDLALVGSHGQTIFHQGAAVEYCGREVASTLQIGDGSVIAARLGCPVVADFRPADMAVGGQGAPLVPFLEFTVFRHSRIGRVALNIGGIANVTAIPAGATAEEVFAFDTGPGNMVSDGLVSQITRGTQSFDEGGKMAAAGDVHEDLLAELMEGWYLQQAPPKSAGREQYGRDFVVGLLKRGHAPEDLVATAAAFAAASIADAVKRWIAPEMRVDQLVVSGGGVHNPQIMDRLRVGLPGVDVLTSSELGIDADAKEAVAFAVMAWETFGRRPANIPSATGAERLAVLGKLAWPPG